MKEQRKRTTSKQIRPLQITVLTGAVGTGSALLGIGKYVEGAITIGIGCITSVILALMAKLLDSI